MQFFKRAGLTGSFLLLIFSQTIAQSGESSSAEWYQNFFIKSNRQPVERTLKQKEDERMQAIEMLDDSTRARILLEMGLINLTRTFNYDTAMEYFIKALVISDSLNDTSGKIFSYLAISDVFEEVDNYEKSLQFLEDALELSSTIADAGIHILVLNELGKLNATMNEPEEALKNFQEVLALEEKANQPGIKADALFNMARLYGKSGELEKSVVFHKRALAVWRSLRNRLQEARLLNEIGGVYEQMNKADRALANYTAAREVFEMVNDNGGIAESYNNIGVLFYKQNKIDEAIENLEKALSSGHSTPIKDQTSKSFEYLSFCYKAKNDFQKALKYKEEFVMMNDMLQKEESDRLLLEVQNRYLLDKQDSQIKRLDTIRKEREREIEEQRRTRNFLVGLIGLGGVVVVLILYLYALKRKSNMQLKAAHAKVELQNVELQNLNATKDKFFSILGHDLKSPLNSLSSFSNLLINYFDSLSKEEIQTLAKDLDKSLKNLYSLLDNLLEWARSQTGNINFAPEQFDVITVLSDNKELLSGQAANKEITLVQEQTTPLLVSAHKPSIATVVRNLVSNAIKFTPKGGQVKIQAVLQEHEVIVSIADTGVGMSESIINGLFRIDSKHSTLGTANEKGTGLGLVLCKDFVEKNGGKLWVESTEGKGTTFYFSVSTATIPFLS